MAIRISALPGMFGMVRVTPPANSVSEDCAKIAPTGVPFSSVSKTSKLRWRGFALNTTVHGAEMFASSVFHFAAPPSNSSRLPS